MNNSFIEFLSFPSFKLWEKMNKKKNIIAFDLEITARCNNNCRHCCINLPVQDKDANEKEIPLAQITKIADEAISQGAIWCLITGGEPLLREDFVEIYLCLKKKGLLVSVFTNATLINNNHVKVFKKYPPRDIEITVYGITKSTYEKVTRVPGSFYAFKRGLNLLLKNKIRVRFKTMALRSNVEELPKIASFCREKTKDYFRFDPFLHLRFDGNPKRNEEIISERLSPDEIVLVEKLDKKHFTALEVICNRISNIDSPRSICNHLFRCGIGTGNFVVSYDGIFRFCSSLNHPKCVYDLKRGNLTNVWKYLAPKILEMRSNCEEFLKKCRDCPIIDLCMWCPAHAYLETGKLDKPIDYFCMVANARAISLVKTEHKL